MNRKSKTALITGSSAGLGRTFASRLAQEGMNLVLVARRQGELESVGSNLRNKYPVEVTILAADLSEDRVVADIENRLRQMRVDLLINNAGFGTVGDFSEIAIENHLRMVGLHVTTPVRLAHAVLPGMIERGEGAIINVCSVNAFVPGHVTYSATKSFLRMFSEALAIELDGSGVKVQALCPGFTRTSFHDAPDFEAAGTRQRVPSFLWLSPEAVVESSLSALRRGKVTCIPSVTYQLIVAVYGVRLARLLFRFGRGIVKR
jgi:uncharacterized protein